MILKTVLRVVHVTNPECHNPQPFLSIIPRVDSVEREARKDAVHPRGDLVIAQVRGIKNYPEVVICLLIHDSSRMQSEIIPNRHASIVEFEAGLSCLREHIRTLILYFCDYMTQTPCTEPNREVYIDPVFE